ncbi:hypothetical protein C2845_PM15G24620 [Panicum miliaceum]|uniref:Uncharacterized protein n=1 Tax=Panicum miliaceum TaxID=4540 RepID=A0A3L6Q9I9_PANMI|nr:hypothetical protein C2845_PM15G24620 [Panicum miliaceum]
MLTGALAPDTGAQVGDGDGTPDIQLVAATVTLQELIHATDREVEELTLAHRVLMEYLDLLCRDVSVYVRRLPRLDSSANVFSAGDSKEAAMTHTQSEIRSLNPKMAEMELKLLQAQKKWYEEELTIRGISQNLKMQVLLEEQNKLRLKLDECQKMTSRGTILLAANAADAESHLKYKEGCKELEHLCEMYKSCLQRFKSLYLILLSTVRLLDASSRLYPHGPSILKDQPHCLNWVGIF